MIKVRDDSSMHYGESNEIHKNLDKTTLHKTNLTGTCIQIPNGNLLI